MGDDRLTPGRGSLALEVGTLEIPEDGFGKPDRLLQSNPSMPGRSVARIRRSAGVQIFPSLRLRRGSYQIRHRSDQVALAFRTQTTASSGLERDFGRT